MALIGTKADFSQTTRIWANNLVGFSNFETMKAYGCLITAFANVAQAQGVDHTPETMNVALRARQQFVRDCYDQVADVAGYDSLSVIVPTTKFIEQKNWPITEVAPADYFDVRATTETEIIVMLDYHPELAGIQSHYCRVIGLNEARDDLEIVDSYTGKRIWLSTLATKANKSPFQLIWTAGKYQKV